jgi:DNA invertase Pin-like site-specific DNA recombinase
MTAAGHDPGGPRHRSDVADERQARLDRTWEEVRRIVAEFHALLPRDRAEAVGAAYARYSSRFQDSVADQVRAVLADTVRKGVFVPLDHVFLDLAVRGVKNDRPGLNALRACLDRKAARVVFFFATNRLFRKTYRSLQFVEQVVERGVRAVFVKSGVDTADARRWRALLQMHAMMDEFVVGSTADHVRAAHEGLLEKRLVFGTVSFGYAGRPLDGQTTRRGKPRMTLVVDEVAGGWVRRVFAWYVGDRLPIAEVVRRLNADPTAPPPPKSPNRTWTHDAVRRLLRNPRYRGWWRYGATETVWVSSKDYARQVTRREPLKEVQIEDLRLVSDDRWYAAQALLAKEAGKVVGRKPRDGDAAGHRRVLGSLFYCPTHDRKLYVGGANGKYLACKDCRGLPADRRPLFSQLPRALALRKTCETLAGLIRADADLVQRAVEACRRSAAEQQASDPARVAALEAGVAKRNQRIQFILRNQGETAADQAESEVELRRLRKERADAQTGLDALRAAAGRAVAVPTDAEAAALVAGLAEVLAAAAADPAPESAELVRELIDLLTGGRIDLEQAGEPRARRGWLRGRFRVRLVGAVTARLTGVEIPDDDGGGPEVVIDYRPDPDGVPAAVAAEAVALYDAGLLEKEVARRLGLARSTVTRVLDARDTSRGRAREDGRTRRATLGDKHVAPPTYREIADRVKALAERGLLFGDIASELELDRNTITAAWRWWHASRGLPVPDGRGRRKTLDRKSGVASNG